MSRAPRGVRRVRPPTSCRVRPRATTLPSATPTSTQRAELGPWRGREEGGARVLAGMLVRTLPQPLWDRPHQRELARIVRTTGSSRPWRRAASSTSEASLAASTSASGEVGLETTECPSFLGQPRCTTRVNAPGARQCACGRLPHSHRSLPRASNTGSTRSRSLGEPEAMITRSPFSAGSLVPSPGASTKLSPCSRAIALIWSQVASSDSSP